MYYASPVLKLVPTCSLQFMTRAANQTAHIQHRASAVQSICPDPSSRAATSPTATIRYLMRRDAPMGHTRHPCTPVI